jgi:hypothetical protein
MNKLVMKRALYSVFFILHPSAFILTTICLQQRRVSACARCAWGFSSSWQSAF